MAEQPLSAQAPTLDSIRFDLQRSYVFRGVDLGRFAAGSDLSASWGESLPESFQLVVGGEFRMSTMDRAPGAGSHVRETATLLYHYSGEEQRVWIGGNGVQFLASNSSAGNLGELQAGFAVRSPWFPERLPLLVTEVSRDFVEDGTFAASSLRFDYKLGPSFAVFLTGLQSWSNPRNGVGKRPLMSHHTDAELRANIDFTPQSIPVSFRLEPFVNTIWSRYNRDPNVLNPGVRLTLVL